jgi:hypothetical protein
MEKVKKWFKENGFVGFGSLIVAVVAGFFGMWFATIGAVGFFLGKNWEIISRLWIEKYKDKVDDLVDGVKDKISK